MSDFLLGALGLAAMALSWALIVGSIFGGLQP